MKTPSKILIAVLILPILLLSGCGSTDDQNITSNGTNKPKTMITATIYTDAGNFDIQLNADETPMTVKNFVTLAQKGFYNGTIFHRVIKNFMIQGGDPKGDGTGDPGYRFPDESFTGDYSRGTLAMANSGPNTNGSQFFIMHKDYPLPHNYVIFGKVTSGLPIIDKIAEAPTKLGSDGNMSMPIDPVKITKIEVFGDLGWMNVVKSPF